MSANQSIKLPHTCEHCSVIHWVKPSEVKRGNGRFCSRPCYDAARPTPLLERFFCNVGSKQPSGCITWTGKPDRDGYGFITDTTGKLLKAHRVSYELFRGPIPDGLHALHACDSPPCINPYHLFLGTHTDNMADMAAKGRNTRGETNGMAKLTDDIVRTGRAAFEAGSLTVSEFAAANNTNHNTARKALNRTSWKHV